MTGIPITPPARPFAGAAGGGRIGLDTPVVTLPLVVCGFAWLWAGLLIGQTPGSALCLGGPAGGVGRAIPASLQALLWSRTPGLLAFDWALMVLAMMVPLALPHISVFCARLFRRDRVAAMGAAFAGYLAVWIAAGTIAVPLILFAQAAVAAAPETIALVWLAAMGWLALPLRARLLRRCHAVPVAHGRGTVLWRGSAGYGLRLGGLCVATCLPVMAATMIAGLGLAGMFLLAHILLSERLAHRPRWRRTAAALAPFALWSLIV